MKISLHNILERVQKAGRSAKPKMYKQSLWDGENFLLHSTGISFDSDSPIVSFAVDPVVIETIRVLAERQEVVFTHAYVARAIQNWLVSTVRNMRRLSKENAVLKMQLSQAEAEICALHEATHPDIDDSLAILELAMEAQEKGASAEISGRNLMAYWLDSHGVHAKEIAMLFGIKVNTAEQRVSRGRVAVDWILHGAEPVTKTVKAKTEVVQEVLSLLSKDSHVTVSELSELIGEKRGRVFAAVKALISDGIAETKRGPNGGVRLK